jgi:hypothetical protein
MREGRSGLAYRHGFPTSSAAKPDRSSPVAEDLQEHQRGAILADALEKAAAGKPHKLALVASLQPSLIVGRNGCRLIAQTLHGHRNAICWVTQAGARHEDASWVPPQPRPCPAASCARKICHIALAVAELPLKLGLVCSSGRSVRAKAGAVSPIATTGVMAECGRGEILSVRP